ncbi:hypothetical protein NXZ84_01855 [Mechercharimyces sp. CAU 1602]|nr:hypothetical protein [Mechercharimyces sp. CAU 1602]
MATNYIDVPIGPAIVEFGSTEPIVFDITKGGVVFSVETSVQDITVDQYGDTPVKTILKGRAAQVKIPLAEYDLERISQVMPDSELVTDSADAQKKKLIVKANAGFNVMTLADKLVIKPTDPNSTVNDYITIPLAAPMADIESTYDSDNVRIYNVTFKAYVDKDNGNQLFILGDETATA